MRLRSLCAAALVAVACAKPQIGPHGLPNRLFPLPEGSRAAPTRNVLELAGAVDGLNPSLGGYPPRFADEADRERVYAEWCDLLLDARALSPVLATEEHRLLLLAELYRMGHNMDVIGAAELAAETVAECLGVAPRSVGCHRSNSFLMLQAGWPDGSHLDRAEASLEVLREELGPEPDEQTEAGFVYLYVYRLDNAAAQRQIDFYLERFPSSPRAEKFRQLRRGLDRPIQRRED
jgi:hypothetical protein